MRHRHLKIDGLTNICSVCGYKLGFLSWKNGSPADEICPSCGIQFGDDDMAGGNLEKKKEIYVKWREKWVKDGMQWFSKRPKPLNWDPIQQLKSLHE